MAGLIGHAEIPQTGRVMIVRDAKPQDAAEMARVHVRSWEAAYRGLFLDDYLDRADQSV